MPKWTQMQQAAIDQRNADILVSAAAGSGKTAVLTERVMQRLIGASGESPIEIDRFLIVTFTSAAAQEMKERILNKISAKMDELIVQEEDVQESLDYLERQMALVPKASISTIHSFCLRVIRDYFNVLDLDPNIKVGNDGELAMMRSDLLDELMETYLDDQEPMFLELAEVYGSVQGLEALKVLILDIDTFSKSTPFPEIWLKKQVAQLKQPYNSIEEMPWAEQFKNQIHETAEDLEKIYDKAMALCQKPLGPELYITALESDLKYIAEIKQAKSLEEGVKAVLNVEFVMLPRKKQECDPDIKEQVKACRDLAKDIVKKLKEAVCYISDAQLLKQLPYVGHLMEGLVQIIIEFEERYTAQKLEKGVLDYSDLEHYALKLLVEPCFDETGEQVSVTYTDVAKELSSFYKEVYIDEYQDSNAVQETLLSAISNASQAEGATRFMVGDMKQSIYRFRLANPLIFAEKYEKWGKHEGTQMSDEQEVCIDLSQNFRSRETILDAANDLFKQVMSPKVGELTYDKHAQLYVGNTYTSGNPETLPEGSLSEAIELHILETCEAEEGAETGLENLKQVECEALMTAELIAKLIKGEGNPKYVYDKELDTYRPVEPRDIAILLRATKDKAAIFENALIQKGIGAYADISSSFFDALEIQTMISLLKIIDNPLQDIPLIAVLRSPIVGLSYDELVHIRKTKEEGYFYQALLEYRENLEERHEALEAFLANLEAYRADSSDLKTEELLARLYVETGYYRYITMLPTGPKKKANLDLLKKYAAEYEAMNHGKLFGFLQYLDKLSETSEGLQEAKLVEGHENLVKIMSIHKSKGLEFSIVFLCDAGKRFNALDTKEAVLMHHELGLGPDYVDVQHYVKYPTLPKLAIKEQIRSENISEEMRILYVALTRAQEKLIITGTVPDITKRAQAWQLFADRQETEILPVGVKRANSYLNWIGMSLYAHSEVPFFRELLGDTQTHLCTCRSPWEIRIWHKDELVGIQKSTQDLLSDKQELLKKWDTDEVYGPYKEEIIERLTYEYPHKGALALPNKISVSEIKRQQMQVSEEIVTPLLRQEPQEPYKPSFIEGDLTIKGAQRGTLIHSVFEHLDYLTYTTPEAIKQEIEKLVLENKLQEEVLSVVDYKRLSQMAESEVIQKMKRAKYVEKEKAFIYRAQAKLVNPSYPDDEEILIQGVIDSFYIDDEGITIIDYKTDYIDKANIVQSLQKIREKYKKQLELYALALSDITNISVAHQYIYLYNINEWMHL